MTGTTTKPRFSSTAVLSTPAALEAFERNHQTPFPFLQRHFSGDWGELCEEDRQANEQALMEGSRILSAYRLDDGTKIWIITEAADERGRREATTTLLPSD